MYVNRNERGLEMCKNSIYRKLERKTNPSLLTFKRALAAGTAFPSSTTFNLAQN